MRILTRLLLDLEAQAQRITDLSRRDAVSVPVGDGHRDVGSSNDGGVDVGFASFAMLDVPDSVREARERERERMSAKVQHR